ncbi:MAG: hypothetical protein QHJ82_06945 [Verrucomicrobiota bacterium]|nr:hypothetical protein [Verrucomicrobiota bacterium]
MKPEVIIRTCSARMRPGANEELTWFRQQPTLGEAIRLAALAVNSRGKRYSHQRRLRKTVLEQARDILLANEEQISQRIDFDDLFALLESLLARIKGLGELYIYDTALRTGAKPGMLPKRVYLHAGTREGVKAPGFDGRMKTLDVSQLPEWLQQLKPHEIEDVLCIFKDKLMKASEQTVREELIRRSWCS